MSWWVRIFDVHVSEIVRNYALIIGGIVGIYLAWKRSVSASRQADAALHQTELARREHVAELFNRAVSQLTDAKLEIRLGAVLTLRHIIKDFPDLADPTVQLLSTYLRENRVDYGDKDPPAEIRAIIETVREQVKL